VLKLPVIPVLTISTAKKESERKMIGRGAKRAGLGEPVGSARKTDLRGKFEVFARIR
jgi:hypothetical protein